MHPRGRALAPREIARDRTSSRVLTGAPHAARTMHLRVRRSRSTRRSCCWPRPGHCLRAAGKATLRLLTAAAARHRRPRRPCGWAQRRPRSRDTGCHRPARARMGARVRARVWVGARSQARPLCRCWAWPTVAARPAYPHSRRTPRPRHRHHYRLLRRCPRYRHRSFRRPRRRPRSFLWR